MKLNVDDKEYNVIDSNGTAKVLLVSSIADYFSRQKHELEGIVEKTQTAAYERFGETAKNSTIYGGNANYFVYGDFPQGSGELYIALVNQTNEITLSESDIGRRLETCKAEPFIVADRSKKKELKSVLANADYDVMFRNENKLIPYLVDMVKQKLPKRKKVGFSL